MLLAIRNDLQAILAIDNYRFSAMSFWLSAIIGAYERVNVWGIVEKK